MNLNVRYRTKFKDFQNLKLIQKKPQLDISVLNLAKV